MGLFIDFLYLLSELKKLTMLVIMSPFSLIAGVLMVLSGTGQESF